MKNPFNILAATTEIPTAKIEHALKGQAVPVEEYSFLPDVQQRIHYLLTSYPIILFMKGTPSSPLCGFSANSLDLLDQYPHQYKTFDILSDQELRQALKEYSNWPTYPQLYVRGKLIGGNDIITELHEGRRIRGDSDGLVSDSLALSCE